MKLIDFTVFEPFNELKSRMGIARDVYGNFAGPQLEAQQLTHDEEKLLTTGQGIDVSIDAVQILEDGTLALKNSRVLLYIRDVRAYGARQHEPRYHLMNCSTLVEMRKMGRSQRYVAATELEGTFDLNLIGKSGEARREARRLSVCQNCLHDLSFDGFSRDQSTSVKRDFVKRFTPKRFFDLYPRSLHAIVPEYKSNTAPVDTYVPHWPQISERIRKNADWKCEKCKRHFRGDKKRFLHVHHLGARYDNRRQMLKVLCLGCHAEEPRHSHLRSSVDYPAYLRTVQTMKGTN